MKTQEPKIVCLGGGIGTVQLLRGLRHLTHNITVVVSMADDGGSAGRLRRLYSVPPPGDLINCLSALSNAEPILSQLLTYRFAGKRWGRDDSLSGHKLGNLILVALTKITGSFSNALQEMQRIFRSHGVILPATNENVSIYAITSENKKIYGEMNIDLGKYSGKREIQKIFLEPNQNTSPEAVTDSIMNADMVIAGPGDLYTTILPVLLVNDIKNSLRRSKAKKTFVLNIANKPFETPNYKILDYLKAIETHLQFFPFDYCLVNNNQKPKIPSKLKYSYVAIENQTKLPYNTKVIYGNFVDGNFPLYHDPDNIAKQVFKLL
jgi:uncharacterized cofD-like protein